jgi:hypothetical protein
VTSIFSNKIKNIIYEFLATLQQKISYKLNDFTL